MSIMRRRLLDDTVQKTAEGEDIVVRSVARMRPGLKLFGKSAQKATTGSQLLPKDYLETDISNPVYGIQYTVNDDGSVKAKGTATPGTSTVYYKNILDRLEDGKTYYYASDSPGGVIRIEYSDGTPTNYYNKVVINKSKISSVKPYIQFAQNTTVDKLLYPMLNEGEVAKPWEPYTGGKPSPSPDYPQEIVNTPMPIKVDFYGKNLVDFTKENVSGIKGGTVGNIEQGINFSYSVVRDCYCVLDYKLEKGKEYYIIFDIDRNADNIIFNYYPLIISRKSAHWYIGDVLKLQWGEENLEKTNLHFYAKFTTPEDEDCAIYVCGNNNITASGSTSIYNFCISYAEGDKYEPYKNQSLTLTVHNGLPGIPVETGGNYTDETGQQWVCDEIDLERGKYVKRTDFISLVNANYTGKLDSEQCYRFSIVLYDNPLMGSTSSASDYAMCNMLQIINSSDADQSFSALRIYGHADQVEFRIWLEKSAYESVDAAKLALADGVVLFPITPIETDLTPEEIATYSALHTNYPTTVVTNDAGAGMKLTYKTRKSLEVTI